MTAQVQYRCPVCLAAHLVNEPSSQHDTPNVYLCYVGNLRAICCRDCGTFFRAPEEERR